MDAEFIPHPGSHKCALEILTRWKMCKFRYEDRPERWDVGAANYVHRAVAWQLEDVSVLNKLAHLDTTYLPNTATPSFGEVPQVYVF